MIKIYLKIVSVFLIVCMVLIFVVSNNDPLDSVINEYMIYDENLHVYVVSKDKIKEKVEELKNDITGEEGVASLNGLSVAPFAQKYIGWIDKYSKQYNVDPILICAMCAQETNFGREIDVSSAGAKGLMQFMDNTWNEQMPGRDVNDDESSIEGACKYAAEVIRIIKTTNVPDVAAAYNQGPGKYTIGHPYSDESQTYYDEVGARYNAYKTGALTIGYKYQEGD